MPKFDVVDSALAGFGLIRRRPGAVLVWGLVLFVLSVLPVTALIGPWVDLMSTVVRIGKEGAPHPPDAEILQTLQSKFMLLGPAGNVVQILSLVARAVVGAAIIRAVVTPKDDRFAYLRVGMGELMLGLVVLVMGIVLVVGIVVVMLVAVALGFVVASYSKAALAAYIIIGCLGLTVAIVWLMLRFSLSGPMSVAEKNFRLFESWSLTRGHAGSLFLVGLLNFLVVMVVETVVSTIVWGVGAAIVLGSGFRFDPQAVEAFVHQPPAEIARVALPWIIGLGLVGSVIGAALFAIMLAPWAHVYKALAEPSEG